MAHDADAAYPSATDEGLHSLLLRRLDGSLAAMAALRERLAEVAEVACAVARCLGGGGTVYTAGNGGSAAQALHLAEELVGRYRSNRSGLASVCLCADPTAITCIANDFGFEQVFARPCEALLGPEDALLVLSTSGESANVVEALRAARRRGATTLGLLGGAGGRCRPLCDRAVVVPLRDTAHIQEAHQVVIHLIGEVLEGKGG